MSNKKLDGLTREQLIELYIIEKTRRINCENEISDLKHENERLQREKIVLERNAHYDILTTLDIEKPIYNRNYLESVFTKENETKSFYMVLADINNLSFINNTYGHKMGDKAIIECAQFLNNYGTVFRFGGDEFVMVFSDDVSRKAFLNYMQQNPDFNLFSYGMHRKLASETISDALGFGDKNMYKMKNSKCIESRTN